MQLSLNQIQQSVKKSEENKAKLEGGGNLNWLSLKDGEYVMLRYLPIPVNGEPLISKEVYRYNALSPDCRAISLHGMTGGHQDDLFSKLQHHIQSYANEARNIARDTLGEDSSAYETIAQECTNVWKFGNLFRHRVSYIIAVITYPLYNQRQDPSVELNTVEGPKLFRLSQEAYDGFLSILASPLYSNPPITDYQNGRRLLVSRKGTGLDTKYSWQADTNPTPFPTTPDGKNYRTDLYDAIPNVDAVFKPDSDASLYKALKDSKKEELALNFYSKIDQLLQQNGCPLPEKGINPLSAFIAGSSPAPSVSQTPAPQATVAQPPTPPQQAPAPQTQKVEVPQNASTTPPLPPPTPYTPSPQPAAPQPPTPPQTVSEPPQAPAPPTPPQAPKEELKNASNDDILNALDQMSSE